MAKFKMAVNCPTCGELIIDDGMCLDLTTSDDVICLDNFQMTTWECKNCGTHVFTPDIEFMYEYEETEDE